MSTRQLRISDPTQFVTKLPDLIGKKIHVVFNDNTALTGELLNADPSRIVMKNSLLKKMSRPFNSIVEIYFDSVS
jgi:hypothetical protein